MITDHESCADQAGRMSTPTIPISELIASVDRELSFRRRCYPRGDGCGIISSTVGESDMSMQEILAKHAERISARREDLRIRLQAYFGRDPRAKAWADDIKSYCGDGVRVKSFRDAFDDSKKG